MATFDNIKNDVDRILNNANPTKLITETVNNTVDLNALESLKADIKSGNIEGGVKALSNNLGKKSVAQLTKDLEGLEDQLVKQINDDVKSDIDALFGSKTKSKSATNSYNDITISSPTPEGLKSSVSKVANVTSDNLNNIISNVVPEEYIKILPASLQNDYTNITNKMKSSIDDYSNQIQNILNGESGNLFLDIIFNTDKFVLNQLGNLGIFNSNIPEIIKILQTGDTLLATKRIIEISTGIEKDKLDIILKNPNTNLTINELLIANNFQPIENNQYADKKLSDIEKQTVAIKPTAADQFKSEFKDNAETYDPKAYGNKWQGSNTDPKNFTTVTSEEELMIDFVTLDRDITRLVFFPYRITPNQTLTSRDIHKMDNIGQFNGITMHYVLRTNGTLQRGRPLNVPTEAFDNANDYTIAIGIVYQEVIKPIQSTTIEQILNAFYNSWPGGSVYSANNIDKDYDFLDVNLKDYIEIFDRENYGIADQPQSTKELIEYVLGGGNE